MGTFLRPKNRITIGPVALALALALSGCSSSGSEAQIATEAEPDTTVPVPSTSDVSTTSVEPSVEPDTDYLCGSELPIFPANFDREPDDSDDPYNVNGTPGPGPDGEPAQDGQLVAYWDNDFGTSEVRWPAADGAAFPDDDEMPAGSYEYAGYPATVDISDDGHLKAYLLLDDLGSACSVLRVSAYGPDPDLLLTGASTATSRLAPRSELASFIAAREKLASDETRGLDRPEGECAVPGDSAEVVVEKYLADRESGSRAQDCLTAAGLRSVLDPGEGYGQSEGYGPEQTCMFVCDDGPSPIFEPAPKLVHDAPEFAHYAPVTNYAEVLMQRVDSAGNQETVRESYSLIESEDSNGNVMLLINGVHIAPESYVDAERGRDFLVDFYENLAAGRYEEACCVYNESVPERIVEQLGLGARGESDGPIADSFRTYCETAFCSAPFEVLSSTATSEWVRTFVVQFMTDDGLIERVVDVSMWEGTLSLNSMPPAWGDK